ncbi:MAG TPA: hypothetical protein PKK26_04850 [Candidatus Wallbacteria bacterium]|nr:hypothetical protein [Candidatus Wallbacteria bacterium]
MNSYRLALFTLIEYIRSTGLYFEALIAGMVVFFLEYMYWLRTPEEVYMWLGIFACASGFFTTLRLAARDAGPRIYELITKNITRREYLSGKILAAIILDCIFLLALFIPCYFLTTTGKVYSLPEASFRLIPIFLILSMTVAITAFFSKIVTGSQNAIAACVTLLLFSLAQPDGAFNYIAPPVRFLIKMATGTFGAFEAYHAVLALITTALFYAAAVSCFKKRELNYDTQ